METLLLQLLLGLNWLLWGVIALMVVFLVILAIAGCFRRTPIFAPAKQFRKIAVLIPSYKEDQVILEVAADALHQDYPTGRYDVVVIADSLKPETIQVLKSMPIKVVEVKFDKSTKAKSHNFAMDKLGKAYDIALVLDADNLMAANFLTLINNAFDAGFFAVQGHRVAKNMNTPVAILDAISEEINNHFFRKGYRALGLSSSLIGSGMAFDFRMYKSVMKTVDAVGGFDKHLELFFTSNRVMVEYLDDAYCYDEKVQNFETLGNQRRRWLSVQFIYLGRNALPAIRALFANGNIDYFTRTWQQAQIPRILLLGVTSIIMIVSLIFWPSVETKAWTGLWALMVIAFVLSVPRSFYNKDLFGALLHIPMGMWKMLLSLLRIKGANKTFIHTAHTSTAPHLQKRPGTGKK